MDKAQKDLESERASHATQIATLNSEKEEITKKYEDNKKLFDKQLASKTAEIAALQTKTKEQFERIARLQEEVNSFNPEDFQTPQGEITRVVDGGNEIWLNLGSADGLQEGVIFKVFDASNATLKKPDFDRSRYSREEWEKLPMENRLVKGADPKATVQVTQIVDSHIARAKVLDSNNRSRPATRDLIFSPGWRSGRKPGFLLAGFDDKDQEEMVKRLIINNRGTVDEKILPGTVYLILGPTRVYENPSPAETEKNKQLSARLKEAKENSLNIMQVDTLLSWLKPKNGERIVPLNTSGSDDFKKRSPK
jgi:hypothetical protein